MTDTTYNGWKNHATWNVALWIQNDEPLYRTAQDCGSYLELRDLLREVGSTETPDGVAWNDSGLDIERLDELVEEL